MMIRNPLHVLADWDVDRRYTPWLQRLHAWFHRKEDPR